MLSYLPKNSVNPFSFKSIRSKFSFWFFILGIFPLLLCITITWHQQIRSIKKQSLDKLVAIRNLKTRQLNAWLDTRIADLKTASSDNELILLEDIISKTERDPADLIIIDNMKKTLIRFVKNYDAYEELFIINPRTGIVEISTNHNAEQINRSDNPYFTNPMQTRDLFINDIYFSKFSAKKALTFSVPIFCSKHDHQHIVGILVARIDLVNSLYGLLNDRVGLGETGETLIVNRNGISLSELRWHENAPLNYEIQAAPAHNAARGKTGVIESRDYRGEKVLAAYSHISKTGWGIVVKQDLTELHAPIQAMMHHFILLFLGALLAIVIVSIIIARAISAPIREMATTARRIRSGDLSARTHVKGSDELASLSTTFNNMAAALAHQEELRKINDEITHVFVDAANLNIFRSNILKKLITVTDSQMGVYFFLNRETGQYEPFTSVGISPERLKPFDAPTLEGEMGRVITEEKVVFLKDIPQDTIFRFRTFTGTLLPREIITIPIVVDGIVAGIVSLAGIKPYSRTTVDIMEQPWLTTLATAVTTMIANAETERLAAELKTTNEELQLQAEELALQARELRQTTEELQEQNRALEIQRAQVQEANQLKSEFLSNMSHELRTPLNSVMALSRVLLMQAKETLSEEELGYLEIIERNGKNLLALINDILDLSKIEAGKTDIVSRNFHISETIEVLTERLEPLAREKGIQLHSKISLDLPRITSDENKLQQILQNIMGNAVKFTSKGSVTISAHSHEETIEINIADTGIGIAEKDLPHIFEEFRQVDGTAARSYEGTGLGLAIAYKTAKLLGGDITVKSTPGMGSTFTLTLPLTNKAAPEPIFPTSPPPPSPPAGDSPEPFMTSGANGIPLQRPTNKKRVLVVEDNESAVIQIKMILEKAGYHVDIATSGRQALNYIAGTIPDGIILDLMMPGMDGFEVLERMRNTQVTASIPVLVLTARDLTPEDFSKLSANHIQQLVQKGDIDEQGLLTKIKELVTLPEEVLPEAPDTPTVPPAEQGIQPPEETFRTAIPSSSTKEPAPMEEKPTVLIVEDNHDNMLTLRAILKSRYTIQEARDGNQGLQMALTTLPDLILLDISLPEMDGYNVANALKKHDRACKIPVIALTAHAMKGDRKKVMNAGCDDYISKPIAPKTLLSCIEKWINHAKNISH